MANDVSYFTIPGDSTTYSFNDADAESEILDLGTKTYLSTSNMVIANSVITLESSQSYVENNILHVAFTILLTGNRSGALVQFTNPTTGAVYVPSARTSYCFLVNASTGAVVVASMTAGGNGYVNTGSTVLASGARFYCFGNVPLD